jgi:hypothetical protein
MYPINMRSLEVHVFECDSDLDDALTAGLVLPEQVAYNMCESCDAPISYGGGSSFSPFVVVIDENDQDWALCEDCASPIINYVDVFFPPVTTSAFQDHSEDLDYF